MENRAGHFRVRTLFEGAQCLYRKRVSSEMEAAEQDAAIHGGNGDGRPLLRLHGLRIAARRAEGDRRLSCLFAGASVVLYGARHRLWRRVAVLTLAVWSARAARIRGLGIRSSTARVCCRGRRGRPPYLLWARTAGLTSLTGSPVGADRLF